MASESASALPETEEGSAAVQELTEEHAEDVAHTYENMDYIARRISILRQEGDDELVEVDRTALEAILDLGSRLQDIQKKSKVSMSTLALAHESYKDKQVNKSNN